MKLLHDFFRLPRAGVAAVSGRRLTIPRDFSVTVPAPLAGPIFVEQATVVELPVARAGRREPASFPRTPRQRRVASGR
jgi:hypothetical protein